MSRLPKFSEANLTDSQRAVYDRIVEKRGSAPAPHKVWVNNPGLAPLTDGLGWYFQHDSALPAHLYEMAILLVARHWDAAYAWKSHAQRAVAAGLSGDLVDALGRGGKPGFAADSAAEETIYDFVAGLQDRHVVSGEVYDRAIALLGVNGVIDLTGLVGYFTMLCATLKVFEIGPEGI